MPAAVTRAIPGSDLRGPARPSRRALLWRCGGGLGGIALADLLGRQNLPAAPGAPAPAAPAAEGVGGADGKQLEADFRRVFEEDFEVVGHRMAEDEHRSRHCLIEAAPRRVGFFTVRFDLSYPPEQRRDRGEGRRSTWYVMVADRGRPRRHVRGQYGRSTTPVACVGDTITFPVRAHATDLDHRFFREPFDPREAEVMLGSDKETADPPARAPARAEADRPRVVIESEVEDHLRLLSGDALTTTSRGGDFVMHYLAGGFEARKPGQFNLRARADGKAYMLTEAGEGLAVRVVPKDTPVRGLADRQHHTNFDGKFQANDVAYLEPGTLVVREGDRVGLALWTYQTFLRGGARRDVVRHPKVTVRRLPFKPKPWPFDHQFVQPEAGRAR